MATPVQPDPAILDLILQAFTRPITLAWGDVVGQVMWLVGQLATWTLILMVPLRLWHWTDMNYFWLPFIRLLILIWVIANFQFLTDTLANITVGAGLWIPQQGGSPLTLEQFMSPSTLLLQTWTTTGDFFRNLVNMSTSWRTAIQNGFIMLVFLLLVIIPLIVCYALAAVVVLLGILEFKLVTIYAMFFLPWYVFSGTAFMAEGTFGMVIASAGRLGSMALVAGIIYPMVITLMVPEPQISAVWNGMSCALGAAILLIIIWKVPNFVAHQLGGSITGAATMGMMGGLARGVSRVASGLMG